MQSVDSDLTFWFFLLAYTMWCWNSCWVGSALSFPVGFSSNSKKEAPIGVPGTSIRSVPTLIGEGLNTHYGSILSTKGPLGPSSAAKRTLKWTYNNPINWWFLTNVHTFALFTAFSRSGVVRGWIWNCDWVWQ